MSRNNIGPVGGGSYFTKILNNQDVNAMPKSTKNAYNFQNNNIGGTKLLPLPRLILNNTQSTASGMQNSISNANPFEGSDGG